jgi:hypothetical protein
MSNPGDGPCPATRCHGVRAMLQDLLSMKPSFYSETKIGKRRNRTRKREQELAPLVLVAEEKLRLDPWHPREGVYAISGTNFNDHCLKNGDGIIELSERSISIGSDKCSVTFRCHQVVRNLRSGAERTRLRAAKPGNRHSDKSRRQNRLHPEKQERQLHRPRRAIVLLRPGRSENARAAKSCEVIECGCDGARVEKRHRPLTPTPAPHTGSPD